MDKRTRQVFKDMLKIMKRLNPQKFPFVEKKIEILEKKLNEKKLDF